MYVLIWVPQKDASPTVRRRILDVVGELGMGLPLPRGTPIPPSLQHYDRPIGPGGFTGPLFKVDKAFRVDTLTESVSKICPAAHVRTGTCTPDTSGLDILAGIAARSSAICAAAAPEGPDSMGLGGTADGESDTPQGALSKRADAIVLIPGGLSKEIGASIHSALRCRGAEYCAFPQGAQQIIRESVQLISQRLYNSMDVHLCPFSVSSERAEGTYAALYTVHPRLRVVGVRVDVSGRVQFHFYRPPRPQ